MRFLKTYNYILHKTGTSIGMTVGRKVSSQKQSDAGTAMDLRKGITVKDATPTAVVSTATTDPTDEGNAENDATLQDEQMMEQADPVAQDIDPGRGQMPKVQSRPQPFTFGSAQRDSMYTFSRFRRAQ